MKIKIPPASAKRLEKNRKLVIEKHNVFGSFTTEFLIPDGVSEFSFEYEKETPFQTELLDANFNYIYYVLYQNAVGTRQEKWFFERNE